MGSLEWPRAQTQRPRVSRPPTTAWHHLSAEGCLLQLESSHQGLSTAASARRLADVGPNKLELSAGRSALQILWDQFSNVMLLKIGRAHV